MVGWHHQLNGHESEQALGDAEGQGSLACCSPWGCNQSNENQSYGRVPQGEEIWRPRIASDMAVFTDWREKSPIKEKEAEQAVRG